MRILKSAAVVLGLALVALPAAAAIKAMTLTELMGITTDVVHGKILSSTTFRLDYPFEGAVWTKLSVEGDSMRTLAPVKTDVVFLGSHEAADRFTVSEMPTLQDSRVGNEAVIFFYKDPQMQGDSRNVVFALDSIYRVETAFGSPVVVGKGEGFAFPENIKLDDARVAVRAAHLELAKKAGK